MAYLLEKVGCWIHLLLLSYDLFMSWNLVVRFYRIIFTNFSTYLFKIVMLSWFSWSEWCILLSSQRCLVLWFFPKDRLQLHLGSAYPFISENARRQGRLLLFVHSKAHLGGGVGFIRMCHYGNRDSDILVPVRVLFENPGRGRKPHATCCTEEGCLGHFTIIGWGGGGAHNTVYSTKTDSFHFNNFLLILWEFYLIVVWTHSSPSTNIIPNLRISPKIHIIEEEDINMHYII